MVQTYMKSIKRLKRDNSGILQLIRFNSRYIDSLTNFREYYFLEPLNKLRLFYAGKTFYMHLSEDKMIALKRERYKVYGITHETSRNLWE
jgi:hypothetical protein